MTDPAYQMDHSDPSTYVNDLLKDAEEEMGDQIFLDGAGFDDVREEEVGEDLVTNELEDAE